MALTVKSATYGDDTSTTNVTDVISGKLKNGKINLRVEDSIVPTFGSGDEVVSLDNDEKADIKEQAIKECKTANDVQCVQAVSNRISQAKLDEKMLNQQRAGAITGNKLTVTFVDEKGREITRVIPKGQTLSIGEPAAAAKPAGPSIGSQIGGAIATATKSSAAILGTIGSVLFTVAWVFSVGATWKTFMEAGFVKQGYIFTAIAVIFPLSGLIVTPLYFGLLKYYTKSK